MNANELADIVDHWAYKESAEYLTDAANMLRQQQADNQLLNDTITVCEEHIERLKAEIEALKQIIDANNLNQNIGQFVKPANKPKIVDMCLRTDANGNVLPQREIK